MLLAYADPGREGARCLNELLQFVVQATRISCAAFYWIDENQRMSFAAVEGIDRERLEIYLAKFQDYDPCRPSRLIENKAQIGTLRDACQTSRAKGRGQEIDRYRPYMAQAGISDAMDLLFCHDGRPIGGLGIILKTQETSFAPETVALARSMHGYVEASLAYHPHVQRQTARARLEARYALSRRELEVAELIGQGLTNQDISESLGISPPTVKTHVQSLFRKAGVANRTSLLAELRLPMAVS